MPPAYPSFHRGDGPKRGILLYPCTLPRLDPGSHRLSAIHSRLSADHYLCAPGLHPGASGNSAAGSRPVAARNGFSRNEGLLSVSRLPVCLLFSMVLNFRTICPILHSGTLHCLYSPKPDLALSWNHMLAMITYYSLSLTLV